MFLKMSGNVVSWNSSKNLTRIFSVSLIDNLTSTSPFLRDDRMIPSNPSSAIDHSLWRHPFFERSLLSCGHDSGWSFADGEPGGVFQGEVSRDLKKRTLKQAIFKELPLEMDQNLTTSRPIMCDWCHIIEKASAVCQWDLQKLFGQRLPDLSLLYIHFSFRIPKRLIGWTLWKL